MYVVIRVSDVTVALIIACSDMHMFKIYCSKFTHQLIISEHSV
jgi:hypothetical protein